MKKVFLSGSLKNPDVPHIGNVIRDLGFDVFDQWHGGGPEADDYWQNYVKIRGQTYKEALADHYAEHIFQYDFEHLNESDIIVMVIPAGRSAHLELGYGIGLGKKGYVYFSEEPERYDVMYLFADDVFFDLGELLTTLKEEL